MYFCAWNPNKWLLLLLFALRFMFWLLLLPSFLLLVRIITNDQRLAEYSRLYISNAFLSILAVPNKVVFWITPALHVMPSFPIHLSNSAETLPRSIIIIIVIIIIMWKSTKLFGEICIWVKYTLYQCQENNDFDFGQNTHWFLIGNLYFCLQWYKRSHSNYFLKWQIF